MARAPERAPALLRAAHGVKTASNVIMLVSLLAVGRWVLDYPLPVLMAATLLGVAHAIAAYAENVAAYFQSIERMHVWTQASAAYGLVTGLLGAVLVVATGSVVAFCAAPIAGQIAALSWLLLRLPAPMRAGARPERAEVVRLLAALAPFAAAFIALTLHSKVDVLLLAHWHAAAQVGIYTAGYKFIDLTQALAVVAAAAMYPRLSRSAPQGEKVGRWAGTRLTEFAILAAVIAGATLVIAREPIVSLLFGEEYAASAQVVAFLAAAIPALVLNIVGGYVLGASGHMRDVALLYGGAVVVKLMLNALLVPSSGAAGAAMAMLATEVLLAFQMMLVLRSRVAASPGSRTLGAVLAAAAVAGGAIVVPDPTGGWLAAIACAAAVAAVYSLAGVVSATERAILLEAMGLRRAGDGA
jgi:O-antigen/teichoic acid export membrane protein